MKVLIEVEYGQAYYLYISQRGGRERLLREWERGTLPFIRRGKKRLLFKRSKSLRLLQKLSEIAEAKLTAEALVMISMGSEDGLYFMDNSEEKEGI
jgi:hypothetical protein